MRASSASFYRKFTLMAASLTLAACSGDITNVTEPLDGTLIKGTLSNNSTPDASVRLAKIGPAGSTATFSISATGGNLPLGASVTLDACTPEQVLCVPAVVWTPSGDGIFNVTITETATTGNVVFNFLAVASHLDGFSEISAPADPTVTVRADNTGSVLVRFKNVDGPPEEEEGFAGCTPGFWKQSQHFQFWTAPYSPATPFGNVFVNAFPGQTLLDVVENGGGGLEALGRHAVAALLNSASPDVTYGMTPAGVISAFNAAVASGDYEATKNQFEVLNERGCTAKD